MAVWVLLISAILCSCSDDFLKIEVNNIPESIENSPSIDTKELEKDVSEASNNKVEQSGSVLEILEEELIAREDLKAEKKSNLKTSEEKIGVPQDDNATLETINLSDIPVIKPENDIENEKQIQPEDNGTLETIDIITLPTTTHNPKTIANIFTEENENQRKQFEAEIENQLKESGEEIKNQDENQLVDLDLENDDAFRPIKIEVNSNSEEINLSNQPTTNINKPHKAIQEIGETLMKERVCDYCSKKLFSRGKLDRMHISFTCSHSIEMHKHCWEIVRLNQEKAGCVFCHPDNPPQIYIHPNEQKLNIMTEELEKQLDKKSTPSKRMKCLLISTILIFVFSATSLGVGHGLSIRALQNLGIVEIFICFIFLIMLIYVSKQDMEPKLPFSIEK